MLKLCLARAACLLGFTLALVAAPFARAACSLQILATAPVTMVGWRPVIPAKIDGAELHLAIVTNRDISALSLSAAKRMGLRLSSSASNAREASLGLGPLYMAEPKTLTVGSTDFKSLSFLIGGDDLSESYEGLLAQNVLGAFDTDYDFGHGSFKIFHSEGCGRSDLAYWAHDGFYAALPLTYNGPHFTEARILVNGLSALALFDTDVSTSFLAANAVRRLGVRPEGAEAEKAASNQPYKALVHSVDIGGEKMMRTMIWVGPPASQFDVVLGMDFFLSHHIYVSNTQGRAFITYNGGAVFDAKVTPKATYLPVDAAGTQAAHGDVPDAAASESATSEPIDAEGYSRRGAISAARQDFKAALADFTRAHVLAPHEPHYLFERAGANAAAKDIPAELADLDAAIVLDPDYADAYIARAAARRSAKDTEGEIADLDAASRTSPQSAARRLQIAGLYSNADQPDVAVAKYGDWLVAFPDDGRRPIALNGRCWARALAGHDLDKALSDCDAALRLAPRTASFFDSRGLVRLRRGEVADAIGDYNDALRMNPRLAWSLYGRGLAELKLGRDVQGRADIAAATALDAKLPLRAAKLGLAPEAFAVPTPTPTPTVASTPALSTTVH